MKSPSERATIFLVLSYSKLLLALALLCPLALPAQSDFASLSQTAQSEREAGHTQNAIAAYQRALQLRPDWEEGLWYFGTLSYDSDRYADAIPAFRKITQLDPALAPAWTFLGLCEFETRDYTNSLDHLRRGLNHGGSDDPDMLRVAKFHLALLLIRSGDFDQAITVLTSTIAGKASDQVKTSLGMALLRIPLLPNEVDPSQDGLIHSAGETALLLSQGDRTQALDSLRDLAKNYPDTPFLHYAYGLALAQSDQLTEALAQFRAETKLSPDSALPLVEISKLELRAHHTDAALQAAQKAVRLAPNSAAAHRALAAAFTASGRKADAAVEQLKVKAHSPETPQPEKRIARLYSVKDTTAISKPTAVSGNFDELSQQATSAASAGDIPAAISAYQKALALKPDWYEGRWGLARLQFASGQYADAIPTLKKCVEFKPSFGTAWAMLGLAEYESKDYKNALIHLQRGQDLGFGGTPESIQLARYRLGLLLNKEGEFDRAADVLGSVAESGPLMNDVQFALGMSLLRVAAPPEQINPSQRDLYQTAGYIALKLQKSKYDDAFAKFDILLRQYPDTPFLHYAAGTAHAALSEYDLAEKEYRRELNINPKSDLTYARLASLFLRQHRAADALPFARQAVQLKPASAQAHYFLGRSLLETGQLNDAIKELEIAEKMAPSSPEVHFNLAKAYAQAKLTDKAKEQRAIFAQLNALAEERRSSHGLQTYGGSRDMSDFSTTAPAPSPQ